MNHYISHGRLSHLPKNPALQPRDLHLRHAQVARDDRLGLVAEVPAHDHLPFPRLQALDQPPQLDALERPLGLVLPCLLYTSKLGFRHLALPGGCRFMRLFGDDKSRRFSIKEFCAKRANCTGESDDEKEGERRADT